MTTNPAQGAAKDIANDASDRAAEAKAAASDAASGIASQAQQAAGQASDAAKTLYEKAKDSVGDLGDKIPKSATDAYGRGADQLSRQVARQPIEALLLAGAIGYLVGWAANRG